MLVGSCLSPFVRLVFRQTYPCPRLIPLSYPCYLFSVSLPTIISCPWLALSLVQPFHGRPRPVVDVWIQLLCVCEGHPHFIRIYYRLAAASLIFFTTIGIACARLSLCVTNLLQVPSSAPLSRPMPQKRCGRYLNGFSLPTSFHVPRLVFFPKQVFRHRSALSLPPGTLRFGGTPVFSCYMYFSGLREQALYLGFMSWWFVGVIFFRSFIVSNCSRMPLRLRQRLRKAPGRVSGSSSQGKKETPLKTPYKAFQVRVRIFCVP